MHDVVRYKVARSPQRRTPNDLLFVRLADEPEANTPTIAAASDDALDTDRLVEMARLYLDNQAADPPHPIIVKLVEIDRYLVRTQNAASVAEVLELMMMDGGGPLMTTLPAWRDEISQLADRLFAAMLTQNATLANRLNRLTIIATICADLANDPAQNINADRMLGLLRERTIVLPGRAMHAFARARNFSQVARRPGFSDLYVVREEWNRYVAGELADVQNVLAGERREAGLESTEEREDQIEQENERTTSDRRENRTADRFELSQESARESHRNVALEGSVDTSGQYGPTKVDTHLGGSLDYSNEESERLATVSAKEIVSQAVYDVQDRVKELRRSRILTRTVETNEHIFDNTGEEAQNVAGVYRWLEKIVRLQLVRFPNRLLFEFQIPEPGAWLRWALATGPQPATRVDAPPSFTLVDEVTALTSDAIDANNYSGLAARFRALGVNPPPGDQVISTALSKDFPIRPPGEDTRIRFVTNTTVNVPQGCEADTWSASVQAWVTADISDDGNGFVSMTVGDGDADSADMIDFGTVITVLSGSVGGTSTGAIPIGLMTDDVGGYSITVNVHCSPTAERMADWRKNVFDQLLAAHLSWRREYDEERASLSLRKPPAYGVAPGRAAELVSHELRRQVIGFLRGANVAGSNAVDVDAVTGEPLPNQAAATQLSPEIQFLEQAFEWNNITYVAYPYYWGRNGAQEWRQLALMATANDRFDEFLRCGSARVIVPARPGFESQAQLYVSTGILWGGGPQPPAPDDDEYLSVAEEVKALRGAPTDGSPVGDAWEQTIPTNLVWLAAEDDFPLINAEADFPAPPPE